MINNNSQQDNRSDKKLLMIALLIAIIFLSFLVTTIFQNIQRSKQNITQIPYAIHAKQPVKYADYIALNRIPGVKLSILWEILADQNLSPEEIFQRINTLEEEFSQSPLLDSSQSGNNTGPLFGVSPFLLGNEEPIRDDNLAAVPTMELTNLLASTQTAIIVATPTIVPSLSQMPSATFTEIPTATNVIIWYPTYTYTFQPPDTPIPPKPTKTATVTSTSTETPTSTATSTSTGTEIPTLTATSTFTPTATETPTPIVTSTFTSTATETPTLTPITCNPDENPLIEIVPLDQSENLQVDVQPYINFNQSMDSNTFIYGEGEFTIAFCKLLNDSQTTCPLGQNIIDTIEFSQTNYFNDTVIIHPVDQLEIGKSYLIYISSGVNPHPQCDGFPDPVEVEILSTFRTVLE